MAHEFFRYLIPGVMFYVPLCVAAALVYLIYGDAEFINGMKSFGTLIGVVALPTGWFIYQAWRTIWQFYRGGYEPKRFLNRIRDTARVYGQERLSRTVVDFTPLRTIGIGILWFTQEEFECVFDPFKNIPSSFGFNSPERRAERAKGRKWYLHFVEPVSDLVLFRDPSYDYARNIASARYGIWVSVFALLCGAIVALTGTLWHLEGSTWRTKAARVASALFCLLFYILLRLVWIRKDIARSEHEARVQLITQMNCEDRAVSSDGLASMLDPQVRFALERAFGLSGSSQCTPRLAAFDMDGTLVKYDMGDAVLAMLVSERKLRAAVWGTYEELLKERREDAYKFAVTAMKGLRINDVVQATRSVLRPDLRDIPVPTGRPVPRPIASSRMQALVMWLHHHNFEIYIVTATNRWAAAVVAGDFFGIPESNVIGVATVESRGRLTDQLVSPTPIGAGKVEAWKKRLGDRVPLVGGGDSSGDHPLLGLVDKGGVVLWMGDRSKKPDFDHVVVSTLE